MFVIFAYRPRKNMWSFLKLSLLLAAGFRLLALTPDSVTVTSSTNPSVYGHPVTLTATVSPAGATGKVTFYDGTTVLETEPLVSGQASMTTTLLPAGTDSIRAWYSGDATYAANSSSVLKQAVNPVPQNGFNLLTSSGYFGNYRRRRLQWRWQTRSRGIPVQHLGRVSRKRRRNFPKRLQLPDPTSTFIAAGDFNGDGKPDLAVTNVGGNVSIFLGNGDGTFQTPASYAAVPSPSCVAVGDFNGDGKADLAIADSRTSTLAILLGNGDGTFQSAVTYSAGSAGITGYVAVGDFNGDGKTDLAASLNATAFPGNTSVAVLLGNGDGTFAPAVSSPSTSAPLSSVTAGDLNGDGNTDLAVITSGVPGSLYVLLGNGDGTFQAAVYYNLIGAVGVGNPVAQNAAIGDFNGDGKADLVVSGAGSARLSSTLNVFYGRGDGTFEPPAVIAGDQIGGFVVSADFDGNGTADLVSRRKYISG